MESQNKSELLSFEAILTALNDIKNEIRAGRKEFQSMKENFNDDYTRINEKLDRINQINKK